MFNIRILLYGDMTVINYLPSEGNSATQTTTNDCFVN